MKEITGSTMPRYPVVTLVLYFGYDRHWTTPRTLFDCLEIPEELKPYVNDYRMNLYEIAYLSDEQALMAVMTQDNRFEDVYDQSIERGTVTMSEVLDCVEKKSEDTIIALMDYLFNNNRMEDAKRVVEDEEFKNQLLKELFGIDR